MIMINTSGVASQIIEGGLYLHNNVLHCHFFKINLFHSLRMNMNIQICPPPIIDAGLAAGKEMVIFLVNYRFLRLIKFCKRCASISFYGCL